MLGSTIKVALRLTDFQIQKLAEFFLRSAQIVVASLVLKIFESGVETILDKGRLLVLSLSLTISSFFFIVGMVLAGKVKEKI